MATATPALWLLLVLSPTADHRHNGAHFTSERACLAAGFKAIGDGPQLRLTGVPFVCATSRGARLS